MPERISAAAAQAAVNRAPERAHARYQEAKAENPDNRKQAAKEATDSFRFSPESRARAQAAGGGNMTTSANQGIDMGAMPQFSERSGVSFGGKG